LASDITTKTGPTDRIAGAALLATIVIGAVGAATIAPGIDVNLSGDIAATAANMQNSGSSLLALGWMRLLILSLELLFYIAIWLAVRSRASLLAGWSGSMGVTSAILGSLGAVIAMNAHQIAASATIAAEQQAALLSLQATLDYTSFHLSLVLGAIAKAGFFAILLGAAMAPRWLTAFGMFASLLVAFVLVGRDFVPILGSDNVTIAFLAANFIALLSLGIFLSWKGLRGKTEMP